MSPLAISDGQVRSRKPCACLRVAGVGPLSPQKRLSLRRPGRRLAVAGDSRAWPCEPAEHRKTRRVGGARRGATLALAI